MSFIRNVSTAFFELYTKTVLMRTPANLSPLKTSESISHITSLNEASIHVVFFSFGIQRAPEEQAPRTFNSFFPFYCPLKCSIAFSRSLSAPLKCNIPRTRVFCRYSLRSVRKTSASLPLLTMSDIWHMGIWNFLKCLWFCPCYMPVHTEKWCEK